MNRHRQTILLAFLGVVLAYFAGEWLFQSVLEGPKQIRLSRQKQLLKQKKAYESELLKARETGKKLDRWESQSLPSDPDIAVSLYRSWLTELVVDAPLSNASVTAGSPLNRKDMYQSIGFSLRATANLQQLTKFLYKFYNAAHLHLIRSIDLKPLPRQNELDISISIEALMLPTANRKDQLSIIPVQRLALDDLSEYAVIAERDFFGFSGQGIHQTDQTFLTAVVKASDQPQAWFTDRSTDQVLKLSQGDRLAIGQFQGMVQDIQGHDVIVESDGERWLMTVGESVSQALSLPPEF